MARKSHDREDLFRDGIQMPIRGRTLVDGIEVVVGFRAGGAASLYWDQDPVYQFNSQHELRRVFLAGVRYAADRGVLVKLNQVSAASIADVERLKLLHQQIAEIESSKIQDSLQRFLSQLSLNLQSHDQSDWDATGDSVVAFRERVRLWIDAIECPCAIAAGPTVR
jgi:hypothetical protein